VADHIVVYSDPLGNHMFDITKWIKLEYIRKEKDFGFLYLDLPPNKFPKGTFAIDGKIEVLRRPIGGTFKRDMDAVWFIRLIRYKIDENQKPSLHILAHDAVSLIDRRIIPYSAKTTKGKKKQAADDMMKDIVYENFGAGATDANRNISDWFFTDGKYANAPVIEKEFAYQKILPLFQEICEESNTKGTYLSFDVVYNTPTKLRFSTYTGQRGVYRGINSDNPVVMSIANGALSYGSYAKDHTEERNYIYAGGRGEDEDKIISQVSSTSRINISPYNRIEDWIDAKDIEDPKAVTSQANERLSETAPKTSVNGHISQTRKLLYGVDYNFGDVVAATIEGYTLDVHLDTVHIVVDHTGAEQIKVYTRNLDDSEY
jgi:hypothetical protein